MCIKECARIILDTEQVICMKIRFLVKLHLTADLIYILL